MASTAFNAGATILIGIACPGATNDDLIGATCTAALKPAVQTVDGYIVPPAATAAVATFTPVARAASPGVGPGWDLTVDPEVSAALPIGTYVTNAVITLASGLVVKTVPLFITITQATA